MEGEIACGTLRSLDGAGRVVFTARFRRLLKVKQVMIGPIMFAH
jgi:hypothetical protein